MSDAAGHFPLGLGKGTSPAELDQFLRESRAFANVGTLDPEGWPMVNRSVLVRGRFLLDRH